jgi:hypothetical protein
VRCLVKVFAYQGIANVDEDFLDVGFGGGHFTTSLIGAIIVPGCRYYRPPRELKAFSLGFLEKICANALSHGRGKTTNQQRKT